MKQRIHSTNREKKKIERQEEKPAAEKTDKSRLGQRGFVPVILFALGMAAFTPDEGSAAFLYNWHTASGPTLNASFRVPDSAIADGIITAAEMAAAPGFSADSPVGTFNQLTSDSALTVDPTTGGVLRSTNSVTATNTTETLLVSAIGYFIPTSREQPRGLGAWRVTHLAESVPLDISFSGFDNGQAQLLVWSASPATFTVEASPDLGQWKPIATNVTAGGSSIVTDPESAVGVARFYRAVIKN